MAADTGARPGRLSTSRAAARKTDCRRYIWPVGRQQADCCSSLDGCESLLELEREQHPWSEIVEQVVADADSRSTRW